MPPPFRLYVISDEEKYPHSLLTYLPQILDFSPIGIQIREKSSSPLQQWKLLQRVQEIIFPSLHYGYINDRTDLALSAQSFGVHLRENSLPLQAMPLIFRQSLSFGVSTHDLAGVLAAEEAGADFVTLSPIFPTTSKPNTPSLGLEELANIASQTQISIFALGGITRAEVCRCLEAGAYGVAMISGIWDSPNPVEEIELCLREILRWQITAQQRSFLS